MKIELMMAINQYPGCPGATGTLQLSCESSLAEPEDRDPGLEVGVQSALTAPTPDCPVLSGTHLSVQRARIQPLSSRKSELKSQYGQ